MLMNLRDKKSAQFILLHKQHFDHRLIELLESLKLQNDKLRQENDYLRASCQNLKAISASLNAQIDSLKWEENRNRTIAKAISALAIKRGDDKSVGNKIDLHLRKN